MAIYTTPLVQRISQDYGLASLNLQPAILTRETDTGRRSDIVGVINSYQNYVEVCRLTSSEDYYALRGGNMKAEFSVKLEKHSIIEPANKDDIPSYFEIIEALQEQGLLAEANPGLLPAYRFEQFTSESYTIQASQSSSAGKIYSNQVRNWVNPITNEDDGHTNYDYLDSRFDNKYILIPNHFKSDYLIIRQMRVTSYMPPRTIRINTDADPFMSTDILKETEAIKLSKKDRVVGLRIVSSGFGATQTGWKIVS